MWWIPQVPGEAFEVPVNTVEQGAILINTLAEYDAFQLINNVKPDYCNSGGLMQFDGDEWEDWQCPETYEENPTKIFPQPHLGYCAYLL